MKQSLLLAALLIVSTNSAQDRLVFIIDTVISPSEDFTIWEMGKDLYFSPPLAILDDDRISTFSPTTNLAPNVLVHVAKNAGGMQLPLNGDTRTLTIRWSNDLSSDTIRIARYDVFDRCIRDTLIDRITYYAVSDTGLIPIKVNEKRSLGMKPKCKKKPDHISLIINKIPIEIPITLGKSVFGSEVTTYHGYRPRGCNNEQTPKGKCTYFHGRKEWNEWGYTGELLIK